MRHREAKRAHERAHEGGFTLLEVLAALLLLGLALAALLSATLANTGLNSRVDRAAEAVRISEERLEGYRYVGGYGALRTNKTETETRRGQNYTVVTTFCPSDAPTEMPCSGSAVYIRLEVKDGPRLLHRAETYYTEFGKE